MLDLSPMRGIQVDPNRRRVTVQAACTWKDLDGETQQFGLAVTGGLVSSTGIAGFTIGGGIGWLMWKYGLASDNLVGADVVTASGQFVYTSADEHPDLFWGCAAVAAISVLSPPSSSKCTSHCTFPLPGYGRLRSVRRSSIR